MADRLSKPLVAIIGGGWAGLAAAVELVDAGYPITVFESARQLGGRARTVDWNGIAIDNGQHLMAGAYTQTLALLRRLGTAHLTERRRLVLDTPTFRLALPGLPAPLHLAAGLLAARGLSLGDKFAAARLMRQLKKEGFRLSEDQPAAYWLRTRKQPALLIEHLWEPICVAALNTPLAIASAQVFANVLRDSLAGPRAASDMLFNRAGLGRLFPEAAAHYLVERGANIRLGCKIERIRLENSAFRLDGPDCRAERVIVASHPSRAPDLLPDLPELASTIADLHALRWQPILTLWLQLAEPLDLPYPMLALGSGDSPWLFERNDIAPGLAAVVASADGPHIAMTPEALLDHYLGLIAHRTGHRPRVNGWQRIIEKRATFTCSPDLRRPDNRTAVTGLYLAGDYTTGDYPATLEGAVRSGVECARRIQEQT